ncbi:MAG: hypothetical protein ACOCWA_04675, partial [Bacteroidota bacterium]
NNWMDELFKYDPDICLLKPSGKTSLFRELYQERIDIIVRDLGYSVYPSYNELRIYENKRFFAYWAEANNVNIPKTYTFYNKKEAIEFGKITVFPIVGKMNIGASGNGITIIESRQQYKRYVKKAFDEGISARTGPKINVGKLLKRIIDKLSNPSELKNSRRIDSFTESGSMFRASHPSSLKHAPKPSMTCSSVSRSIFISAIFLWA